MHQLPNEKPPCVSSYKPSSTTLDHPEPSCKTTHTTQPAPPGSRNCSDLWSPALLPPFVVTAPGRVSPRSDISISLPPNLSFLNILSFLWRRGSKLYADTLQNDYAPPHINVRDDLISKKKLQTWRYFSTPYKPQMFSSKRAKSNILV